VLIVDDDEGQRTLLAQMTASLGFAVATASDGENALEQHSAQSADIIVTDLMMPRMDGFEFVAEIRKQREWRAIPIIVITAKSLTREDQQLLQGHVQKVLLKGDFSREELLNEVREMVAECMRRARAGEITVLS